MKNLKCMAMLGLASILAASGAKAQGNSILGPRSSAQSQPVALARNGEALCAVTVSPQAEAETQAAAADLATYLKRISGAPFEVKSGDGRSGIVVGTLADFPHPALAKDLAVRGRFDGQEAYAIRSGNGRLLLLANTPKGVSHACYRFLESLGCRWFFPAREWEVVPTIANLTANIDEVSRPKVLARNIWYGFGIFPDQGVPYDKMRPVADYRRWLRANRMDKSIGINIGHAWSTIIQQYRPEFEAHPEYLAEVNEVRQKLGPRLDTLKLCVSNPGVEALVRRYVVDYFAKYPAREMVSLDPTDGGGHCECDRCKALGGVSNRVYHLANIGAKELEAKLPGKLVGLYAYSEHSMPPDFVLEPNIYVELTAGFNTGKYTFPELESLWRQKTRYLGFYMYFSVWSATHDAFSFDAAADVARLSEFLKGLATRGASSLTAESGNNWGPNGRGYYVASKVMWDPEIPLVPLLKDFYEKAFGGAAAPMQQFYERLDPANKPLKSRSLLAECFQNLAEAKKLAGGDTAVQARVRQLMGYLHYLRMHYDYEQISTKDLTARKAATLELLNWAYRTRYHYMEHYMAMKQAWAREAASEFKEPDWVIGSRVAKPWETGDEPRPEEIERLFEQDKRGLEVAKVEKASFSAALVPVMVRDAYAHPPSKIPVKYQGGPDYLFYSIGGEPIELAVTTGLLPVFRNKPDAKYRLLNAEGQEVLTGSLKLDNVERPLKLPVPGAGLYQFSLADSAAGWEVKLPESSYGVLQLDPARRIASLGLLPPMYFYVPKGTKSISFYYRGFAFKMHDGAGKLAMQVPSSPGEYFNVPIADGQDGQVWSATSLSLGYLGFENVPSYLSRSADRLLVPHEVAVADKLVLATDKD